MNILEAKEVIDQLNLDNKWLADQYLASTEKAAKMLIECKEEILQLKLDLVNSQKTNKELLTGLKDASHNLMRLIS